MPKRIAVMLIKGYRALLSPIFLGVGCRCRFHPTCSEYALGAFERHSFFKSVGLSALRLLKCGPWHAGGFDMVPLPTIRQMSDCGNPHNCSNSSLERNFDGSMYHPVHLAIKIPFRLDLKQFCGFPRIRQFSTAGFWLPKGER